MPLPVSVAFVKSCNIVGKKPNCVTFAKPTVVGMVDDANNSADRPLLDGCSTQTHKMIEKMRSEEKRRGNLKTNHIHYACVVHIYYHLDTYKTHRPNRMHWFTSIIIIFVRLFTFVLFFVRCWCFVLPPIFNKRYLLRCSPFEWPLKWEFNSD